MANSLRLSFLQFGYFGMEGGYFAPCLAQLSVDALVFLNQAEDGFLHFADHLVLARARASQLTMPVNGTSAVVINS